MVSMERTHKAKVVIDWGSGTQTTSTGHVTLGDGDEILIVVKAMPQLTGMQIQTNVSRVITVPDNLETKGHT